MVAGPTASRIEFGSGFKERRAATDALVLSAFPMVPILSSKGTLRISFACHAVFNVA
jgi:hypothetical protein